MARTLLSPQSDRLNYSEMLRPADGYQLDFALGLTYSLDLEALLGVPVSLGMLDDIDKAQNKNPFYLLEAIRRSADKIAIFCNAGSIEMPQNVRSVFALLENSVFEVLLPRKANFHPKLWVIQYSNQGGDSYLKVVVLTRNLTLSRGFDLAVELTGIVGDRSGEKHRPLSDLLEYVSEGASSQKRKLIRRLASTLLRVESFDFGGDFSDYTFHPFGFRRYRSAALPLFEKPNRSPSLTVSPFLSSTVLSRLASGPHRKTLITRRSSLTNGIIALFDEVYVPKTAVMTDDLIEDETPGTSSRDLHAKLYFVERGSGEPAQKSLMIGSLNATNNAFYRNIELLLELHCKANSRVRQMLYADLLPETNAAFERVETISDPGEEPETAKPSFRDILEAKPRAEVRPDGERFVVRFTIQESALPARIALLNAGTKGTSLVSGARIPSVLLKELSQFYILSRENVSIVVKIPTEGIPLEERDSAIFKAIIPNSQAFLKYVALMLSEDFSQTMLELGLGETAGRPQSAPSALPLATYERLLKTAAHRPERLDEVEKVMALLDDEIVTLEFRRLVDLVREAAQTRSRRT